MTSNRLVIPSQSNLMNGDIIHIDKDLPPIEFGSEVSTAAKIALVLEQRIINREFMPGSRLVEEELVNVFKVSRSPVREALRLVASDGLVKIESRRGARVSQMNATDLNEVYECRLVLEGLATERAAERCDDRDKVILRHKLDVLESAHAKVEPGPFFEANVMLTNAILEAAKSITLVRLIRTIAKQGFRYRYLAYQEAPDLMQRSIDSNREIINAICMKRAKLARTLMEELLLHSWTRISTILDGMVFSGGN